MHRGYLCLNILLIILIISYAISIKLQQGATAIAINEGSGHTSARATNRGSVPLVAAYSRARDSGCDAVATEAHPNVRCVSVRGNTTTF